MKNWSFGARVSVLSLALVGALPLAAQAQTPLTLKEVVVTANRSEQLLTEALPHTTVVGRDAIERSQATDLSSLLSNEAGFQFTQNGGRGTTANLFLRGSAALQVLVLIDGVPLTKQDTTGNVGLENIMLDQVERVEIVRGNVSAIYGSGAIGGVIQVFTRQGAGTPKGFAQLEVGSFGSVRSSAGFSGKTGGTRFSVGVGHHKTDGFSVMDAKQFPNENPESHGYSNSNYNLGLSQELARGHTLGLRAQGVEGQVKFNGGGFGAPTDIYKGRTALGTVSLFSRNQITKDWQSELTWSEGRESSVYDANLTAFPYESEAVTRSRTLNWTHAMALGSSWLLTAGAEGQRQSIDATDSSFVQLNRERGVNAVFAGLAGAVGVHSLQLNVRRDDADNLAAKTTGYAGYGFQLTPAWKLIGTASTAFNLPPLGYLYDLYSGNPALQPETARSVELGVQWEHAGQMVRVTAFKTQISNMLLYDFAALRFNNVTDVSNNGLELSYSGKTEQANLRASLTLQDPVDETTGLRLIRRARTMASFGAMVPMGPWSMGADLRYTASRPDTPANPSLPSYTLANLMGRYVLTPEIAVTARIENVFDSQYQTAYGYNQSGRALYVGILWTQK